MFQLLEVSHFSELAAFDAPLEAASWGVELLLVSHWLETEAVSLTVLMRGSGLLDVPHLSLDFKSGFTNSCFWFAFPIP